MVRLTPLRTVRRAPAPPTRRPHQSGFSMVELLIATFLLFLITVGILPLFARSAVSNALGSDLTLLSNHAKSQAERVYQVPFNGTLVTIPAGETMVETRETWNYDQKFFEVGDPVSGTSPHFVRTTRIRQYSLPEFGDEVLDPNADALDGGAPPENVQLKEIEVVVQTYPNQADPTRPGSGVIPGRRIVVRTLKPF